MEDITELFQGYKLIQKKKGFRFSSDAILLAEFVEEIKDKKVLEIGTGSGIIPILLKIQNKIEKITTLEIQNSVFNLAKKNIEINNLDSNIEVINIDVKNYENRNFYDTVISNPPYMKVDGKNINKNEEKTIARHEISLELKDLIINVKRLLKPRGNFYMIHRTYRLPEIIIELNKNNMFLEKLKFVYHGEGQKSNLVLIKANKGKNIILEVEEPLYLAGK
ncbi:MAG: tRNA1(Val) (adenine(37)-N6)-methyltransferase [Fusobacteriaceae bacterium]